jgi:hypothetical protein
MAVTQAEIDHLRSVIVSGEKSASYDGRSVNYRDLDELRSLLASMEAELAAGVISAPESIARRRTVFSAEQDLGGGPGGDPRLDWNRI